MRTLAHGQQREAEEKEVWVEAGLLRDSGTPTDHRSRAPGHRSAAEEKLMLRDPKQHVKDHKGIDGISRAQAQICQIPKPVFFPLQHIAMVSLTGHFSFRDTVQISSAFSHYHFLHQLADLTSIEGLTTDAVRVANSLLPRRSMHGVEQ